MTLLLLKKTIYISSCAIPKRDSSKESALKTWPSISSSHLHSSPPLWGENKAELFHDVTDRLNHYLHHVDEVQKEFLGVLLPVSGKFWVPLSNEGFKHAWSNAILHTLQITRWKRKVVIIS